MLQTTWPPNEGRVCVGFCVSQTDNSNCLSGASILKAEVCDKFLVVTSVAGELERTLLGESGEFKPDITLAVSSL